METIKFYDFDHRIHTARVVDKLPEVEPLDVTCGYDQVIACERVPLAYPVRNDQLFNIYRVTEYWGRQNDDPDDVETNADHYYIALEYEP